MKYLLCLVTLSIFCFNFTFARPEMNPFSPYEQILIDKYVSEYKSKSNVVSFPLADYIADTIDSSTDQHKIQNSFRMIQLLSDSHKKLFEQKSVVFIKRMISGGTLQIDDSLHTLGYAIRSHAGINTSTSLRYVEKLLLPDMRWKEKPLVFELKTDSNMENRIFIIKEIRDYALSALLSPIENVSQEKIDRVEKILDSLDDADPLKDSLLSRLSTTQKIKNGVIKIPID